MSDVDEGFLQNVQCQHVGKNKMGKLKVGAGGRVEELLLQHSQLRRLTSWSSSDFSLSPNQVSTIFLRQPMTKGFRRRPDKRNVPCNKECNFQFLRPNLFQRLECVQTRLIMHDIPRKHILRGNIA
jgi:hypothetical protein